MIADGKPVHWPKMLEASNDDEQSAVRALAAVRRMIVEHRKTEYPGADEDWRVAHAQTDCIENVVGGLIADCVATHEHWNRTQDQIVPLREENEELKAALEEAKRPFTAQMTMQNRRIIALTAEIDMLKGLK